MIETNRKLRVNFKSLLITNNLLNARGMNPSNYPNLNESTKSFSKFEGEVKEMLSTNIKCVFFK